jgi:hypothetical protein
MDGNGAATGPLPGQPALEPRTCPTHNAAVSSGPQEFWCYKRGLLVLRLSSAPGPFVPTRGPPATDPEGLMAPCNFGSGQFMSMEWEPRVRLLLDRAQDLVELIELLEDRRYQVDLEPPSKKARPFRFL